MVSFFSNKSTTNSDQSTQQVGTSQNVGGTASLSTPVLMPGAQSLMDQIVSNYLSRVGSPLDLTGYQANANANINRNAQFAKQNTLESLAARGIGAASPASAVATSKIDAGRIASITDVQNSLPLLQNQLQNEILNNAGGFFSRIPFGQQGNTSNQQYGSTYGMANTVGTSTTTSTPSIMSVIGPILAAAAGGFSAGSGGGYGVTPPVINPNPSGSAAPAPYGTPYAFDASTDPSIAQNSYIASLTQQGLIPAKTTF